MVCNARVAVLVFRQRADEAIFTAADHWLTTLPGQAKLAQQVIQLIEEQIADRRVI